MSRLRSLLLGFAAAALAAACQGGNADRDREECDRLVDHLVDLQLGEQDGASAERAAEHEKHRRILGDAIRDRVVADCLERPVAHADCALAARTRADLEECE